MYGAKVSWDDITKPFSEGGLDIKGLLEWNKALILHHLCNILSLHSTSIWVKWSKANYLKGKIFFGRAKFLQLARGFGGRSSS